MQAKAEIMAKFQKDNQSLKQRIDKMKIRLRGKIILEGTNNIILDSILAKVTKFRVYLNFINDKYNIFITVNETMKNNPSKWEKNAINILNSIPTT